MRGGVLIFQEISCLLTGIRLTVGTFRRRQLDRSLPVGIINWWVADDT